MDVPNGTDRICATFKRLREAGRKALIPFIMGGDPDFRMTKALLACLAEAGADLIEVGIPFSDPLADGPVIQRASSRSLANGTTPDAVLETVASVSKNIDAPIVLLSYWNPILQYGDAHPSATDPSPFLRNAKRCGVSGVIVPDLPPEEAAAFRCAAGQLGIATVFLAAPTSPTWRLRQIAHISEGFIYYVSVTGTTGVRERLSSEWLHGVRQIKLITTKPVCVGFGISRPSQAASVARVADGVIVGSALLEALEPCIRQRHRLLGRARSFIQSFRRAI